MLEKEDLLKTWEALMNRFWREVSRWEFEAKSVIEWLSIRLAFLVTVIKLFLFLKF